MALVVETAALAVSNGFLKSDKANTAAACTVAAVSLSLQVRLLSIDDVSSMLHFCNSAAIYLTTDA